MSSPSKSPTMEPVQESHPHLKASVSEVSTSSDSPGPKQLQEQTEHEGSLTRTQDAMAALSVGTEVDHRSSEEEEQRNNFNNNLKRQQDAFLKSFPPGYRFNPRDDELVQHYLQKKILNQPLPPNKIMEVNLYRHNPETLAENYETYGEKEWYLFTPRDRKYRNGRRPNRAAGDGYWKATGADKYIFSGKVHVGYRKALVFYRGKPPKGKKTSWIMHEYRVLDSHATKRTANDMRLDNWVLCRIYKKAANKNNKTQSLNHEADLIEESISTSLPDDMEIEIEMNGQVDDTQAPQSEGEHPHNIVHQAYEFDNACPNYAYTYPPNSGGRPMLVALNNNMLYHQRFQPIPLSSLESYTNMLQMQQACGTSSPVYPDQNFGVQFSDRNRCVQFSDQKFIVHPVNIPPESMLCTEEAPDQKCVVQIPNPKLVNDTTSGSTVCTVEACFDQKYDMQFSGQDISVQPHDAVDRPPSMPCDQKSIQQEIGKPLLLPLSGLYIEETETEVDRSVFYDPTFPSLGSFWP